MTDKRIIIIVGHYGSGKTNVAVNLAVLYKSMFPSRRVTLIDLDTVNPYFRAADAESDMKALGIRTINPEYANTNVDIPSLPAEIASVFVTDEIAIFDVGGCDGAAALGVYEREIKSAGYEMYDVINMYRPLTSSPESAVSDMREIESYSRLYVTGIINNSNLGDETTSYTVEASLPYAEATSSLAGVPLVFTTAEKGNLPANAPCPFELEHRTKCLF